MRFRLFLAINLTLTIVGSHVVSAQDFGRRDRGDRGDRGGDRGDRGGRGFGGDSGGGGFGGGSFGPPGGGPSGFGGGGFGPPGGSGFSGGGFGPPGGFGGGGGDDRSSRFGSMMDANGNGKIDQEEIDRIPSFVRDRMKERGMELKAGMSMDDMRNGFRSSMSGGAPGQPGQQSQPGQPSQQNNNGSTSKVLTPYKMKPKEKLTVTLPQSFTEFDTDYDGQIGLDEWLLTRRIDLDQFDVIDTDFDGILIPEELIEYESGKTAQQVAAASPQGKLRIVTGVPTRAKSTPNQPGAPGNPGDPNGRGGNPWGGGGGSEVAMAPQYFERLDGNRDGYIDPDEWQQSRRVRGMFEQAGIKLERMSLQQFTDSLAKVTSNAGNDNSRR